MQNIERQSFRLLAFGVSLKITTDILRSLWRQFRVRDPLKGILLGSVAAILSSPLHYWLDKIWRSAHRYLETNVPHFRAPIAAVLIVIAALLLPSFLRKTVCVYHSWETGLIRGSVLVWAVATFIYWMTRRYASVFILVGVVFEAVADTRERYRKREGYSPDQIASWIPRTKANLSTIEFDKPIEKWEQDAIGRQEFVETVLTRVLVEREPAIGITAEFGEGKSSVLHLIQKSIEHGGQAIAVPFRSWLPGSEETFLESLFATATVSIQSKYFLPSFRSVFKKYGRAVLGVVPKGWAFLQELLTGIDSQPKQIEELTNLFSKLPVRVVFLLDEIDRMHLEELTVLLKILRGAPELTNVSYVCAFSKEAVVKLLSADDAQFGSYYLEKFFPVQLNLPRIDGDLREYLFSARLTELLESEKTWQTDDVKGKFTAAVDSLWFGALEDRLTNFRSIGQLIRGFQVSLHVLKDEVDIFDLLVIESVRILLPGTYDFIFKNGEYFHRAVAGIERWNRSKSEIEIEKGSRKKAIFAVFDEYFGALSRSDRDLARDLLSRIFSSVSDYFREKTKGLAPAVIKSSEQGRRIDDANFFPRYFIYAVPATMFGEKEMDDFINSIREADSTGVSARVEAILPSAEQNDLRRIHFFRRLRDRASEIPDPQLRWLAIDISRRTATMLSDHIVYQVAKGVIFALAARLQRTPHMQKLLEKVIQEAGSDRFASDIVYSSVSQRDTADEITNWSGFNDGDIKNAFGKRMRLRHPKPVSGNLPSGVDDPLAFSRWRFYVPEDVPYLTEFFESAFDYDIRNVGVFLQWLLPGNVGYEGGAIKFVESFYPVGDVIARLKEAEEDNVQWTEGQSAAIQRFWEFYAREGQADKAEGLAQKQGATDLLTNGEHKTEREV